MKADVVDGMIVLGLVLLAAGLAAFDWRLSLVVCGGLLLAMGLALGWRAGRGGDEG